MGSKGGQDCEMVIRKGGTGVRVSKRPETPKCCGFIRIVILIPPLKPGKTAQEWAEAQ